MKISFLKKNTRLLFVFSLFLGLQACDPFGLKSTGELLTLEYDAQDFQGLDLCLNAAAEVRIGDAYHVEITGEETAMPYIVTKVENGVLKVYFERNVYDVDNMKIVVTAPSWNSFEVSGGGKIDVVDVIDGQTLRMDVSGSGRIKATEAHFDNTDLEVSGSGELVLDGTSDALDCDISGSGEIKCFDYLVRKARVKISGSGNAQVNVEELLDADISGSGDIVYKGNPQVNAKVSGSGSVRKF